jgi:hypothetical protein
VRQRKEVLKVELVHGVRSAWEWLEPAQVELFNAFLPRQRVQVPHSFMFKLRRDLSDDEQRMVVASGARFPIGDLECREPSPDDVLCLVKTHMADAHLQQAPLMVLPRTRAARVRQVPRTVVPRAALCGKRAKELLSFARVLESPAYGLREAAVYVRGLVTASCVGIDDLPRLPWLESHATPFGLANPRGGDPVALPSVPWNLKVRFKRLLT